MSFNGNNHRTLLNVVTANASESVSNVVDLTKKRNSQVLLENSNKSSSPAARGHKKKATTNQQLSPPSFHRPPLKTVARTMSVEFAKTSQQHFTQCIKVQDQIIQDKQNEIRLLKKQIKQAESIVTEAGTEKLRLTVMQVQTCELSLTDTHRILQKAAVQSGLGDLAFGHDSIDDMCLLCETGEAQLEDLFKLATTIAVSTCEELQKGALCSLVEGSQQRPLRIEALKMMCTIFLETNDAAMASPSLWILIVKAIDTTTTIDGVSIVAPTLLVSGLQQAATYMKQVKQFFHDGPYSAFGDKCPIIDLLKPAWEAMSQNKTSMAAQMLGTLLRIELLQAVIISHNHATAVVNYSMPTEANIAGANGFAEVATFLRSATETELALKLFKQGRMAVHHLIDNKMSRGKVLHESQGSGRNRVLILRKAHAETLEQRQKLEQRNLQYKEMLGKLLPSMHLW